MLLICHSYGGNMRKLYTLTLTVVFSVLAFLITTSVIAADLKCGICGMKIPENAKNHIILKHDSQTLHICSPVCALKAKKYDSKFTQADIADFNHPEHMLSGTKVSCLVKSEKIKEDIGSLAMAPHLACFVSKNEAEVAQKKYGDGTVIEGFENALNAYK